jgi:sugar (pentulose or hexulose) kinase
MYVITCPRHALLDLVLHLLLQVPSFTITKLLWLKRHEPEVWAQVASVLLPHDFMNFWLTGKKVTEVSRVQTLC